MCGILAALFLTGNAKLNRAQAVKQSQLLRHRGPDDTGVYQSEDGTAILCQERLSIIDPSRKGRQPFVVDDSEGRLAWIVNSEIYNHQDLRNEHFPGQDLNSNSDSVIVGHMYKKFGGSKESINQLDGIFASVIYDETNKEFIAFRDPMGICPLYWGKRADGSVWFASEMKALEGVCESYEIFPPGHIFRSSTGVLERWYQPLWMDMNSLPSQPADLTLIRETFVNSVVKRLMSDVPLGVLLSGGLDSSLVASVAVRHIQEANNAFDSNAKLHTFSIGLEGAPDLEAAQKVADFLGTIHHNFTFSVEEGIDALRDLIYHIESYEQVRAAVPMYLLARRIKSLGIKVVLSGEGADEMYGGYLYFHKAPNATEFHQETIRKVTRLHQWDVLRANKSPFAFGLETRVPFLDKEFLEVSMNIDPSEKMCNKDEKPDGEHPRLEKYLLRKAFDIPEKPYLPSEVLWRQKEQFSDGVGYDWVDGLRDYAEEVVSDEEFEMRAEIFPDSPPRTKEYFLLRSIFKEQFPSESADKSVPKGLSIACSTPEAVSWDPSWANIHEISGRAIAGVHDQAAQFEVTAPAKQQEVLIGEASSNGAHAVMNSEAAMGTKVAAVGGVQRVKRQLQLSGGRRAAMGGRLAGRTAGGRARGIKAIRF